MKTNKIQMIYLPKEEYMISIRGIIPKEDNPMTGRILLSGNPINCVRDEYYIIEKGTVFTDSWNFSVEYLAQWLINSGSIQNDGKGNSVPLLQEVLFECNEFNGNGAA